MSIVFFEWIEGLDGCYRDRILKTELDFPFFIIRGLV